MSAPRWLITRRCFNESCEVEDDFHVTHTASAATKGCDGGMNVHAREYCPECDSVMLWRWLAAVH